jgi:hypothetical protein
MYLINWKKTFPLDKVHVPHPLEGMRLVDWKGFLPIDKVHVPCQPELEGFPANQ